MKQEINIIEYAKINGMSPDEFENDMVNTLVALCSMKLDKNMANGITFSVDSQDYNYKVVVSREIK